MQQGKQRAFDGRRRNGNRWRRASRRGVSPIIATILLVAITVVLAAVLYVLVSGLTRSGASVPYELAMTEQGNACTGSTATSTCTVTLNIDPTSGLTTGAFGMRITNVDTSTTDATVATTATCINGATEATACLYPAATGWYAVLVASGGTVAAVYSGTTPSWSAYATGTTTIALTGGYQIVIVSPGTLDLVGVSQLAAFGVGSSSVSGTVNL